MAERWFAGGSRLTPLHPDRVPSWWASHAARLDAREDAPDLNAALDFAQSWLQWVAVALVASAGSRSLPKDVDPVLRAFANGPATLPTWRALVDALLELPEAERVTGTSHGRVYGLTHPVGAAYGAVSPLPVGAIRLSSFLSFLQPSGTHDSGPIVAKAIAALAAEATWILEHPAVVIEASLPAGGRTTVIYRRLTGTGYPARQALVCDPDHVPPVGSVVLWDLSTDPIPVPPWLARWDPERRELLLLGGRTSAQGAWRRETASPHRVVTEDVEVQGAPSALTGRSTSHDTMSTMTTHGIALSDLMERWNDDGARGNERARSPMPILRVVAGIDLLRFADLIPGRTFHIGRNPADCAIPVQHGRVSRTHARIDVDPEGQVFVKDTRSSNGTRVDGRPVGDAGVQIFPGDVVLVGPVPLRFDVVDAPELARLRRAARREVGESALLAPRFLDDRNGLARWIAADPTAPATAILARGGEMDETSFAALIRLGLFEAVEGDVAVQLGQVEALFLVRRDSEMTERFAQSIGNAFLKTAMIEQPAAELQMVVATRNAGESAGPWLLRLRQAMPKVGSPGFNLLVQR